MKKEIKVHSRYSVTAIAFVGMVCAFALFGCSTSKSIEPIYFANNDPQIEAMKFVDSLKASNVETIVGYANLCHDCSPYSKLPYYVFWKSEDDWYTTKFTRTNQFNTIHGYDPLQGSDSSFFDTLISQELVKPNFIQSSYGYEHVYFLLLDREFDYVVRNYEKELNLDHNRVMLADSLRSVISTILEEKWKKLKY